MDKELKELLWTFGVSMVIAVVLLYVLHDTTKWKDSDTGTINGRKFNWSQIR
jgi:hypothetical protein